VQDSKSWQRPTKRGSRQEEPPVQEFRGLPNRVIITIVLSLVCFGLMAVYSSSANEALQTFQDSTVYLRKQAIAALVGCFLMFYMSRQDYRKLRKYAWPLALASLFLLALTLVPHLSVTAKGSSRWLALGPLQFQPSEMAKVSCIILLASGLSKYFWWHRQVLWRVGITVAIAFIVMKQPDLGTGLMILGAILAPREEHALPDGSHSELVESV
jgi:cell division protein FtsW